METEQESVCCRNISLSWWSVRGSRARGHAACGASLPPRLGHTNSFTVGRAGPGATYSEKLITKWEIKTRAVHGLCGTRAVDKVSGACGLCGCGYPVCPVNEATK